MPRIVGPLLACSLLYLYLCCTGTQCQIFLPNSNCMGPHWFRCQNGQCMPYTFQCDGDVDCVDGSDEKNCTGFRLHNPFHAECAKDEFQCEDNDCIPLGKFCDSTVDCADGSDEYQNCTDKLNCEGMFRCRNGHCVRPSWRCDGVEDCVDGSDELDCEDLTTPTSECKLEDDLYLCPNKQCISLLRTCDGKDDCDGQDENGLCSNGTALCESANCDHECRKTPQGAVCVCEPGYKLVNNRTCIDIDECATYGICDHHCVNTPGSYGCLCEKSYTLQEDKKTCKANDGEATLVFSTRTEIRGVHLESQIYYSVMKNVNNSNSVAINGDHVYWSQGKEGNQMIVRMFMEMEEQPKVVVRIGLHTVSGIAIDWITGNIYFADNALERIGVCDDKGLFCTILIKKKDSSPRGITLSPSNGMMYWCEWGPKPQIVQAGMDGQNVSQLVSDNLGWPSSSSIDYPNGRLYWVDTKLKLVESIRLDGTDRRGILRDVVTHPFSIAVFENKLYWSDWDTSTIQYCDKFTGKDWVTLVRTSNTPLAVHIDHSAIKPKFKNPCKPNPCSDLCLLKRDRGYTCACTMDRKLTADNHTCQDGQDETVLVFAGRTVVKYYHELIGMPRIYSFMFTYHVTAVAYDSLSGTVLISDQSLNYIMYYDPVHNDHEAFSLMPIDVKDTVVGMEYDYIGNNLYMSFAINKIIEVVNLETFNKTIFNFDKQVHDIALVPEQGMMFVVFSEQHGYYVDRLRMDATSMDEPSVRAQLKTKTISKGPKLSLSYDNKRETVFMADQATGFIWAILIKDLKVEFYHTGIKDPVNIVSTDKYVYWNGLKSSVLSWVNEYNPLGVSSLDLRDFGISHDISHMVTLRNVTVHGNYTCQDNNGNCSHVCLTTSATSFVCACPPTMTLAADNRSCLSSRCLKNKIPCSDYSSICIDRKRWCDGFPDCPFHEDESINCKTSNPLCGKDKFLCGDGSCIDLADRCNWHFDCFDKSDEQDCGNQKKCPDGEFFCDERKCIHPFLVCNGKFDCTDLTDEINCKNHTCSSSEFMCNEPRQCISVNWLCDGEEDCWDGSDELGCELEDCKNFPSENFRCKNDLCISSSLRCNGVDDCDDNSDEQDCWDGREAVSGNCNDDEYPCVNTDLCIAKHLRCNGVQDCPKNDDEHQCLSCLAEEFRCKNKKCIPKSWVCDTSDDCGDHSDEEYCNGHTPRFQINFNTSAKCDEFQCSSTGMCLPYAVVCNGVQDCLDGSDEQGKCSIACARENNCEELCFKTPQGGVCGCREGYRLDDNGISCVDINECEDIICSQFCENTVGSYQCSCLEGYAIRSNGVSCKAIGPPMEIFAVINYGIKRLSLSMHSVNNLDVSSDLDITGIDVNAIKNFLYWSNGELGVINRMNLETRNVSKFVDTSYPGRLAVDWITDNVYFINMVYPNTIRVCNLETTKCATVIPRKQFTRIICLLVDPINRWLYWSESTQRVHGEGQIFRAYMKGTHMKSIVSEDVGYVDGMAIDYMTNRLYWVDLTRKVIESSNLDGTERRKFLKEIHLPMNIGIYENTLYLLMYTNGQIKKCPLYGKRPCDTFHIGRSNIYNLFAIMHVSKNPQVANLCDKHSCDHMCILDVDQVACMCEDGKLVEPNDVCVTGNENGRAIRTSSVNANPQNARQRSGTYGSVIITLLIILLVLFGFGYCYYQKNKSKWRAINPEFLSFSRIHFQNPSFDRADEVAVTLDRSRLVPGQHEYANPIDNKIIMAAEECSIEKLRRVPEQLETAEKQDTLISLAWQK